MQNEFEKQVKLKMEELDLVPSAPVWKKIEEQIREKKDKRRMILWIFVGALLLGGGIFWISNPNISQEKIANAGDKNLPASQTNKVDPLQGNKPSTKDQQTNSKANNTSASETVNPKTAESVKEGATQTTSANSIQTKKSASVKQNEKNKYNNSFSALAVTHSANKRIRSKPAASANNQQPVDPAQQRTSAPAKTETPVQKIADSGSTRKAVAAPVVVASAGDKTPANPDKQVVTNHIIKDSVAASASVAVATPLRHHSSKWQFGFSAGVGASALTNGLSFGSLFDRPQSFSFDATPSTTVAIPYVRGYVTAVRGTERKSTSFSLGFVMRKLVGKKLNFSTGLNYAYYSTIIDRGNVNSGTLNASNGGSNMFSVNGAFYNYVNQFHFVGLPVAIDISPVRKLPIYVKGGLAVQQLVSTNALIFDQTSKAYTHNENAYEKTQLFSELGLNYSLRLKNAQLLVGPQISYGISKTEKIYPSRHLFSFGLNAQFLFSKK